MTERNADPLDTAAQYADAHNADALARQQAGRQRDEQIHDDEGKAICLDCEQRIPQARLAALPGAARCIDCQEQHDEASP